MSSTSEQTDIEDSVERAQWEPMHEWESRVKFVEDNVARHGLEKAIQLSIVWANMRFLGCKYPVKTECLVDYYPLPSLDELRERRKHRPPKKAPPRVSDSIDGPPETKKPAPSRQEVSNLISSIRSATEPFIKLGLVESMGRKVCLCTKCIGRYENVSVKAMRVLERHTALCNEPVEMSFRESTEGHVCTLMFRGEVVIEKTASKKKDAKSAVCAELVKRVEEWQESNQLPPCKHTTMPTLHTSHQQPPHSYTPPQNHYPPPHNQFRPPPRPNTFQRPRFPPPSQYSHAPPPSHAPHSRNTYPPPPTNANPPPNTYHQHGEHPQYHQRGNYFMPPPSRGGGNHGYTGDGYYRQ